MTKVRFIVILNTILLWEHYSKVAKTFGSPYSLHMIMKIYVNQKAIVTQVAKQAHVRATFTC